ncbi:MAG: cupin domain-containing protein [Sporomusaceae bacterium]|nr:cupin domain-containing protein [Sporomusaceae bacterium]
MIVSKDSKQIIQLDEKSTRRVLVYGPSLMLVEFAFKKGGVGKMHKHEAHEQVGYVARGSFEITVGGETKIACEGDCYYADRNVLHGVVALEDDSVLIDTFTPIREDFLPQ